MMMDLEATVLGPTPSRPAVGGRSFAGREGQDFVTQGIELQALGGRKCAGASPQAGRPAPDICRRLKSYGPGIAMSWIMSGHALLGSIPRSSTATASWCRASQQLVITTTAQGAPPIRYRPGSFHIPQCQLIHASTP